MFNMSFEGSVIKSYSLLLIASPGFICTCSINQRRSHFLNTALQTNEQINKFISDKCQFNLSCETKKQKEITIGQNMRNENIYYICFAFFGKIMLILPFLVDESCNATSLSNVAMQLLAIVIVCRLSSFVVCDTSVLRQNGCRQNYAVFAEMQLNVFTFSLISLMRKFEEVPRLGAQTRVGWLSTSFEEISPKRCQTEPR